MGWGIRSLHGSHCSEVTSGYTTYQILIKEASTLRGAQWLSYDREFRERVAAKKRKHWGEWDPNLWAKFFSNITLVLTHATIVGEKSMLQKSADMLYNRLGAKSKCPAQHCCKMQLVACPQPVLRGLKVRASPSTTKEHVIETCHAPFRMCV